MGIISGSVSFRGRFGDHFRVGDHFGVGIISGIVQIPIILLTCLSTNLSKQTEFPHYSFWNNDLSILLALRDLPTLNICLVKFRHLATVFSSLFFPLAEKFPVLACLAFMLKGLLLPGFSGNTKIKPISRHCYTLKIDTDRSRLPIVCLFMACFFLRIVGKAKIYCLCSARLGRDVKHRRSNIRRNGTY